MKFTRKTLVVEFQAQRFKIEITFASASLMSFVCISFETVKFSKFESSNTYPKMINPIHLIYNKTEIPNA